MLEFLFKKVVECAKMLKPPKMLENGDKDLIEKVTSYEKRTHRWRWIVFCSILILFSYALFDSLASWGATDAFDGFAFEEKVQILKEDLNKKIEAVAVQTKESRIEGLETALFDLRIKQCTAIDKGDPVQVYTFRIDEFQKKYEKLTGKRYRLPACAELR